MPYSDIGKNMNKARVGEPVRGTIKLKIVDIVPHYCSAQPDAKPRIDANAAKINLIIRGIRMYSHFSHRDVLSSSEAR